MDVVGHVVDVTSRGWNYMQDTEFEEKLDELRTLMGQLRTHRDGVLSRVEAAEARLLKRTPTVDAWLKSSDDLERDVTDVLQEGTRLLEKCCISVWCPWNCWTNQKFGKKVMSRISLVRDLRDRGNFQDVAERPTITTVQEIPEDPNTVGLDAASATAWSFLQQDSIGIVGIYGLGGVGKTTLLKKINNMFLPASSSGFDFVIWVVVSKEVSIERVQKDIGRRLGLSWEGGEDMSSRAQDIFNMLRSKNFLLLLDDIWERLELTDIGIPLPSSKNKSKIIFTTRSSVVCGFMDADKKIRVECLNASEAWELFQSKVGVICNDPEIEPRAKTVAEECGGLPLALTVIGRTMASKTTVGEWENAITILRKHAQAFTGMEDKVYSILKFSYDSLPDDSVRLCFLFCSLYPEDYDIRTELVIREWIGQGYIDEFDEWEEAVNRGHDVIGVLKACCLLESGVRDDAKVKMHDVIRDMAHWIACERGREKYRILVIGDHGMSVTRRTEKLKSAQMISMSNVATGFNFLGEKPDCPNVTTLFTCVDNISRIGRLHDDLFLLMPALRFLSLGNLWVTKVPTSIGKLVCLEYLSLRIGGGHRDQMILPCEMKNLTRLRFMYLNGKHGSCRMPVGVIRHLSNLQVLYSRAICFGEDMGADIQELGCLNQLISLEHITISIAKDLEFFFSHRRLLDYTILLEIDGSFGSGDRKIIKCPPSSSSSSCLSLGTMKRLKHLWIWDCLDMEELVLSCSLDEKETDLCQSLEHMSLWNLPKCKSVVYCDVRNDRGLCFGNLKKVSIEGCHSMLNVTWLLSAPKLKSLDIIDCDGIEEILCEGFGAIEERTFSNLETLGLWYLPNLRLICAKVLPFPSLEVIRVIDCPKLRRLPLKPNNRLERMDLQNLPKFELVVYLDVRNLRGLCFGNLKKVSIDGCHSMLNVTWLLSAPKLESLEIRGCDGIEEILCEGFGAIEGSTFSNLKKLWLWDLPNLRLICANVLPFPSLEEIRVNDCPGLRRLPLKPNNKWRTIQFQGRQEWWDNLEWESHTTKSAFAQFYDPRY